MTEPVARENFDPYHKWLGISPKDQPPHYYRLLAVDLFESDPDVIAAGADKQMAYVRSFQAGKNSQLSQKLLNEIAAARVCLLNAEKKALYDGKLRTRMAAEEPAPEPAEESLVVVDEPFDAGGQISPDRQSSGSRPAQIRKKKSTRSTIGPLVALGVMFVLCAVAIGVVMLRPPPTNESQASVDGDRRPPGVAEPRGETPASRDSTSKPSANPAKDAIASNFQNPTHDNGGASPSGPPEAARGDNTLGSEPGHTLSGENRPNATPKVRRPLAGDSVVPRAPEPPAMTAPAQPTPAKTYKTLEELGKQTAEAKTPEDYQRVAHEALRAADKAIGDNQQEAAKNLLLAALTAARKSNDSKLVFRVTRALTKPETVKEILAETERQEEEPAAALGPPHHASPAPKSSSGDEFANAPALSSRAGARPGAAIRVALAGTDNGGVQLGPLRRGTLVTLQYDGGKWNDPVTHKSICPDDKSRGSLSVVIYMCESQSINSCRLPLGTASHPFQWRADRNFDAVSVQRAIYAVDPRLAGLVYYRISITPPGK